jgi:hypothetical protein
MEWPRILGFIEICLSFSVSAAFVVVYAARNRWWTNNTGRGFMAMMFTLAVTLGLAALGQVIAIEAGPQPSGCAGSSTAAHVLGLVRLGVFSLVPFALAWPLLALLRGRRGDDNSGETKE